MTGHHKRNIHIGSKIRQISQRDITYSTFTFSNNVGLQTYTFNSHLSRRLSIQDVSPLLESSTQIPQMDHHDEKHPHLVKDIKPQDITYTSHLNYKMFDFYFSKQCKT